MMIFIYLFFAMNHLERSDWPLHTIGIKMYNVCGGGSSESCEYTSRVRGKANIVAMHLKFAILPTNPKERIRYHPEKNVFLIQTKNPQIINVSQAEYAFFGLAGAFSFLVISGSSSSQETSPRCSELSS